MFFNIVEYVNIPCMILDFELIIDHIFTIDDHRWTFRDLRKMFPLLAGFKFKEDEKFNCRNIWNISRIKFWVWRRNWAKRGVLKGLVSRYRPMVEYRSKPGCKKKTAIHGFYRKRYHRIILSKKYLKDFPCKLNRNKKQRWPALIHLIGFCIVKTICFTERMRFGSFFGVIPVKW